MKYIFPNLNILYNLAIEKYGIQNQLVVVMEELSELIKECSKLYRNLTFYQTFNIENMIIEIIDVSISTDILKCYLKSEYNQIALNKMFSDKYEYKINRFKKRIKNNTLF